MKITINDNVYKLKYTLESINYIDNLKSVEALFTAGGTGFTNEAKSLGLGLAGLIILLDSGEVTALIDYYKAGLLYLDEDIKDEDIEEHIYTFDTVEDLEKEFSDAANFLYTSPLTGLKLKKLNPLVGLEDGEVMTMEKMVQLGRQAGETPTTTS